MKKISGKIIDLFQRKIYTGEIEINSGIVTAIKETPTADDQYILPGFIDAHIHIESSMLTPAAFARMAVVHGTVATVSDPHEIANVNGIEGVQYMIDNSKLSPFKFFFGAPSCVPATSFETAGATLDPKAVDILLQNPDIWYLSEMMNYPGVLHNDAEVMAKIAAQFYKEKSKLLLVSLENDKISSQEKLKTYSKIFGFPFLSVENLQELKALLLRERGYNLILVDAQLEIGFPASRELLDTLGEHNPAHLNLVLSMTEKEVLHDRIISQLASNSISSLIFSKLDQAWNYGHILNLCEKWKIPVSYLSLGPKVPEDLEKASREKIIERMFGL